MSKNEHIYIYTSISPLVSLLVTKLNRMAPIQCSKTYKVPRRPYIAERLDQELKLAGTNFFFPLK